MARMPRKRESETGQLQLDFDAPAPAAVPPATAGSDPSDGDNTPAAADASADQKADASPSLPTDIEDMIEAARVGFGLDEREVDVLSALIARGEPVRISQHDAPDAYGWRAYGTVRELAQVAALFARQNGRSTGCSEKTFRRAIKTLGEQRGLVKGNREKDGIPKHYFVRADVLSGEAHFFDEPPRQAPLTAVTPKPDHGQVEAGDRGRVSGAGADRGHPPRPAKGSGSAGDRGHPHLSIEDDPSPYGGDGSFNPDDRARGRPTTNRNPWPIDVEAAHLRDRYVIAALFLWAFKVREWHRDTREHRLRFVAAVLEAREAPHVGSALTKLCKRITGDNPPKRHREKAGQLVGRLDEGVTVCERYGGCEAALRLLDEVGLSALGQALEAYKGAPA